MRFLLATIIAIGIGVLIGKMTAALTNGFAGFVIGFCASAFSFGGVLGYYDVIRGTRR